MRFLECGFEAFGVYVRVDLRGGDVRVSEHFFDAHDFGTVFEEVRCKTVAQHVRARFPFPANFAEQIVNVVAERADAVRLSVVAQEHIASFGGGVTCFNFRCFEFFKPRNQRVRDGDNAFFAPLADDAD